MRYPLVFIAASLMAFPAFAGNTMVPPRGGVTPYVEVDPQAVLDSQNPQNGGISPLEPLGESRTTYINREGDGPRTQTQAPVESIQQLEAPQDATRKDEAVIRKANPDGTVNNPLPQPVRVY